MLWYFRRYRGVLHSFRAIAFSRELLESCRIPEQSSRLKPLLQWGWIRGEADAVAAGIAQMRPQRVGAVGRKRHAQPQAVGGEAFLELLCAETGERGVHRTEVVEAGLKLQRAHRQQRDPLRGTQALGGGTAIGAYQAAGTELDAAVPARHHHHHPVAALA